MVTLKVKFRFSRFTAYLTLDNNLSSTTVVQTQAKYGLSDPYATPLIHWHKDHAIFILTFDDVPPASWNTIGQVARTRQQATGGNRLEKNPVYIVLVSICRTISCS